MEAERLNQIEGTVADLRGRLALGDGLFSALNTRVGYSDYTHTEFEGDEVGTVFDTKGIEARAVLEQNRRGGWGGSTGVQFYFRDFDAFGAEAYVPKNATEQLAIFSLQEFDVGPVHLEVAGRYETTDVESQRVGFNRSFDTFSGALGIAYETAGGLRFGVNGSRAARAPSAEELLSNGPHIATQAFEIGDPDLTVETAWGLEGYARGALGAGTVSLAVFNSWFDDYIYMAETGGEEDGVEGGMGEHLYTTPEDGLATAEALGLGENGRYMVALTFGNVHGVYKPGNVKLRPELLGDIQAAVGAKYGKDKPFDLVFHGGSGSTPEEIALAVSHGVIKMNIDTDLQYAFTRPIAGHMLANYDGVLKVDGEVGNKKHYDPRAWGKLGEAGMAARVVEAAKELGSAGKSQG